MQMPHKAFRAVRAASSDVTAIRLLLVLLLLSGLAHASEVPKKAEKLQEPKLQESLLSVKFARAYRDGQLTNHGSPKNYNQLLASIPDSWRQTDSTKKYEKIWIVRGNGTRLGLVQHETGLEVLLGGIRNGVPKHVSAFLKWAWRTWIDNVEADEASSQGASSYPVWSLIVRCPGRSKEVRYNGTSPDLAASQIAAAQRFCTED